MTALLPIEKFSQGYTLNYDKMSKKKSSYQSADKTGKDSMQRKVSSHYNHLSTKHYNKKSQPSRSGGRVILASSFGHFKEEEERENLAYKVLKEYKLFTNEPNEELSVNAEAKIRFKEICTVFDPTQQLSIKACRLTKKQFRHFLSQRYKGKLPDKFTALFDWGTHQMEYIQFYQTVESLLLKQSYVFSSAEDQEKGEFLKEFTFILFDQNGDNHICELDLFGMLKIGDDNLY